MTTHDYGSFAEAYIGSLEALLDAGEPVDSVVDLNSVGSRFGLEPRSTVELRPFVFRVHDPAACLIRCRPRQPRLAYVVGQWLWTMSGSDDLEHIAYYNAAGRPFSEDGTRLPGAFGARMRRSAGDQLERAIALLRRDPGSRRAVIVIQEAADSRTGMRDFPCAAGLQFLVRDGKLELLTNMRSQSALMVLPYDAALFMMLQVWVAAVLDIDCGPQTWIANSFHLYEDELSVAAQVRSEGADPVCLPTVSRRGPELLPRLLEFERQLRIVGDDAQVPTPPGDLADMTEFHGALAAVLRSHRSSRSPSPRRQREAGELLPPTWRGLLNTKPRDPSSRS